MRGPHRIAARPSRHNPKSPVVLHRSLLFLHAPHIRPPRPVSQLPGELLQLLLWPHGVHLHPPIVQVAGIACQPQTRRRPLGEVPEPDPLYAPTHQPSPRILLLSSAHARKHITRGGAGPRAVPALIVGWTPWFRAGVPGPASGKRPLIPLFLPAHLPVSPHPRNLFTLSANC